MEGGGGAAIQELVKTLIDATKGEISLIRGLKKNAEKLQNSLTLIQSYLDDAEKKLITEEAVKTWLKQLDDAAFDAHNVLDELNYHLLSKKMKSIRIEKKKKKVLPSCFPSCNRYIRRRNMALMINKIYVRFESLLNIAKSLNLHSQPAIAHALTPITYSFTVDPIFIGRDKDVKHIVDLMLTRRTTEQTFFVLPIVGMGGLGKTTLTRRVFNHERIKSQFGKQIWVHVSKNFDVEVLLEKIRKELGDMDIRKELGDKTYLLVLDDVWNEDIQMWENFENSLAGLTSTKGNFILVTTRSKQVASIVRTLDVHNLSVLSDEVCWSIIKQKALSKEEEIPFGFESTGNKLAERCRGSPLAANVVGGLLRRTAKDEWIATAENWLSNLQNDDNDISKILRFSFDYLSPPSLKRCFAYCSIFPKGEEIDKQELIELWMAQGYLHIDSENGMEIEGNKFFYILVQNSLLQVARHVKYNNRTYYSMHDLVHDLACIVSKGIYQVQYIGTKNGGDESSCIPKEQWRTLFFGGKVLSNTMLLNFKSLHALTLMDERVEELPSSIDKLIHLRLLNISSKQIRALPDSIGDLYHLQTLRAVSYVRLRELPSSVQYLINLRHLHVELGTKLPPNIGRLTCLQTLEYYHVGEEEGHKIGELGRLKNLRGDLHILNLENVHHQIEAESAYIFEKQKLHKLVLVWSKNWREGETDDDNVLEGLRPHTNLKVLEIIGFNGTRLPSWMKGLHNLMRVSLSGCYECEEISMMGHLPQLKTLNLSFMMKVKSICSFSSCKDRIVVFPVLRHLSLSNMPELVELIEIEMGENEHPLEIKVFPCLEELKIDDCRGLRMNPSEFSSSSHKELYPVLHMCGSLINFDIDGVDELEYLPDLFFLNNQNLSKLVIRRCHKLRELPDGLETLNSLKVLEIEECPNLKSIAHRRDGESQGLISLEKLIIRNCGGLISFPCEMLLHSNAPSFKTSELKNLSSLMNLAEIIDCLPKMSSLNSLTIWNVPKLISPAPAVFPNLHDLCIKLHHLDSSESAKKGVDGMLQAASHSLTFLHLEGMDDWDSLPHSLQHLNALSWLSLFNFGIEELPEWFGNLTSLKSLDLTRCKELRSVGIKRCLKKLTYLSINDCDPELKRWIGQQTDDVSHIPNIRVDRRSFREDGVWILETDS